LADAVGDPWPEVLREALASTTQPVIGTHFRAAVTAAAAKRDLQFPPPAEPQLRFIQLIQRYPDTLSVLRRPGQDFLVVAAGRTDLFAKGLEGRLYGLRRDLFQAFSVIGYNRPFYDKNTDRVTWQKSGDPAPPTDSCVPIPPATQDSEVQLRRDFADALHDRPEVRTKLTLTLENALPLQAFSGAVRELELQKEWHTFRTERLVDKIERWARDNKIEWKDAWLTQGPSDHTWKQVVRVDSRVDAQVDALRVLLSGMDAADMQRVSIPLDLVLKAITSSRKH